jgi:hypothetical protein
MITQKAKSTVKISKETASAWSCENPYHVTNVNVGMGATDPVSRLQKFLVGVTSFTKISVRPPAGVNLEEVWKEIMALSGYQDGERFTLGANPEMARLQQTNTQLMQMIQQLKMKMHNKSEANQVKREVARENNIVKLVTAHKEVSRHLMGP